MQEQQTHRGTVGRLLDHINARLIAWRLREEDRTRALEAARPQVPRCGCITITMPMAFYLRDGAPRGPEPAVPAPPTLSELQRLRANLDAALAVWSAPVFAWLRKRAR